MLKLLFKNTFLFGLSSVFTQAVNFILLPVYSQYLDPVQYGIIASMQVLQTFFVIFYTLSIEKSILRLFWDYSEKTVQQTFLGTITLSIIVFSILGMMLTFIMKPVLSMIFSEIPFFPYYSLTIVISFFFCLSNIPLYYYRLIKKAQSFFILSVIRMVINTGLILLLIMHYRLEAKGVLIGQVIAFSIMVPVYLIIIYRNIPFRFEWPMLKSSLRFSLPMIPSVLAGWTIAQADRLIIAQYFNMYDLGIYSMAKKIASIMGILSTSVIMAYHPIFFELANSNNPADKSVLKQYNHIFLMLILFTGFIFIFFSKDIFIWLIDPQYFKAYQYLPLIILSSLITSLMSVFLGAYFQQSKKMKQDMYISIFGALIYISSNIILIRSIGLFGAIITLNITAATIFIIAYFYAKKYCYFIDFQWGKIAAMTLGLTLVFFAFEFIPLGNLQLLILKIVTLVLFFIIFGRKYITKIFALMKVEK